VDARPPVTVTATVIVLVISLLLLISACQPDTQSASSAASGLRLNNILGEPNSQGFARAEQRRDFIFPEDHGPHPRYRSEWWYLTAALEDENGNEYGVHFTLFRQALSPQPTGEGPWHTGQAYLGHLAVTDISTGTHFEAERFARGHPELAGVSTGKHFRALIEDWTLEGSADGKLDLTLSAGAFSEEALFDAEEGRFSVDLQIRQSGPMVLQGNRGLSEKGPDAASYYYSIPRMPIKGTLRLSDRTVKVKGLGWLDREWSTSVLGESLEGWDWFSLQMMDQRSIMAFRLRRHDGLRDDYDHGLLVDHRQLANQFIIGEGDRGVEILGRDDFSLNPTRFYQDTRGINWPVSWTLNIGDEHFTINALLDQQTVDLSIIYWEGLVEVLDSDGSRSGVGYMELTGYERER
jgi:predicted secreted hydrolase